jgi:hypothetical protein
MKKERGDETPPSLILDSNTDFFIDIEGFPKDIR